MSRRLIKKLQKQLNMEISEEEAWKFVTLIQPNIAIDDKVGSIKVKMLI
jgi:hypothetical protein